jgi:short-subunit dehydrogenase
VARKGATPVLLARTASRLSEVAKDVSGTGAQARYYAVDCSDREAVVRVASQIEVDVGTPDVIVNCAGGGRLLFFDETDPEDFEPLMATPFFAAVYVTRAFVGGMIARGSGYIVSVNSPIAFVLWPGAAGYAMSRWALRGLTEALRVDLKGTGVRVGQVVSSTVASGYFEHNPGTEERLPKVAKMMRMQTPDDVARKVVRAIEREKRILLTPFPLRQLISLNRLLPPLIESSTYYTGASRPGSGERE